MAGCELVVEPVAANRDTDGVAQLFINDLTIDDVGVFVGNGFNDLGGFVNLGKSQIRTTGDREQNARSSAMDVSSKLELIAC